MHGSESHKDTSKVVEKGSTIVRGQNNAAQQSAHLIGGTLRQGAGMSLVRQLDTVD
jgi:hypothetical protein